MTAFFQSAHSLLRLMKLDMINYEIGLAKPHMQQVRNTMQRGQDPLTQIACG